MYGIYTHLVQTAGMFISVLRISDHQGDAEAAPREGEREREREREKASTDEAHLVCKTVEAIE